MKGKRQRRKADDLSPQRGAFKSEIPPSLEIKFNISRDSLACFVGEKKNSKKKTGKKSASLRKPKKSLPKGPLKPEEPRKKAQSTYRPKPTESEQIVQGSLNLILCEIENKGIGWGWGETSESVTNDDDCLPDDPNCSLWSAFSVRQELNKSYGSTMDVQIAHHPNNQYYQNSINSINNMNGYYIGYQRGWGQSYDINEGDILGDPRTTVMIRNIPNKYSIKELTEEIDQVLPNTYDFLYLPCDIKNQCNVGYGFVNFVSVEQLLRFYQYFHGRRWRKFRSEKICNLTYARLQGLHNLIEHFENSKVLNQKDKKYRPVIRQYAQIDTLVKAQQQP